MNEGLVSGDIVIFCNTKQNYRHNALVVEFASNGFIHLIHVIQLENRNLPQVELNVPWTIADLEGRYYVVEAERGRQ